jgi:signal peptidase I
MARNHRTAILVLRTVLCTLVLIIAARALLLTSYKVSGSSMRETLQDGDHILVCELPFFSRPIALGDTVILDVDHETLVKRVMAGPGDSIAMISGTVLRNGKKVEESIPAALNAADSFPPYFLRTDEYFVMGDHRNVSIDSRAFGPVKGEQVRGKVMLRMKGISISSVAALERPH